MTDKKTLAQSLSDRPEKFELVIPSPENPTTKVEKSKYINFINHEILTARFDLNIMELLRTLHDLGETHLSKDNLYMHRDRLRGQYGEQIDDIEGRIEMAHPEPESEGPPAQETVEDVVSAKMEVARKTLAEVDPESLTDDQRVLYERVDELYHSVLNVIEEYYQQVDVLQEMNWLYHLQKHRVMKGVELETTLGVTMKDVGINIQTLSRMQQDIKELHQELGMLPNFMQGDAVPGDTYNINVTDNRKVELHERRQQNIDAYIDLFKADTDALTDGSE